MVLNILVVDDDLIRHYGFVEKFKKQYPGALIDHAYSYKEAIAALEKGPKYDLIQLDLDLNDFGPYPKTAPVEGVVCYVPSGKKEYTGTDIALWMAQAKALTGAGKPDMIIVHSHNSYGTARMVGILNDAGFTVFAKLFAP